MNTENNSRICKLYLQFDESNIEHAQARKITEACIRSNDYNPALGSFIKLAEKGDRAFQHNTGVLMQCISDVRDYDGAVQWYRAAVKQNFAPAKERLAVMYEFGEGGLPVDNSAAVALYRESADQGNMHSIYNLGMILSQGSNCVPQNLKRAEHLLLTAATSGHALMKLNLGIVYLKYFGEADKAAFWFNLAVTQDPYVALDLGELYLHGEANIAADMTRAEYWLAIAVAYGYESEVNMILGDQAPKMTTFTTPGHLH